MSTSGLQSNIYAETKWESYVGYRPTYPDSLVKQILDHHRAHSNCFRLAHDVGAGNGEAFSQRLGLYFDHVHVSDPSASNISDAYKALGKFSTDIEASGEKHKSGTFTMSVTPAETAHECTPPQSVDLISMASAAWWMDIDAAIRTVGKALKPGGTLAIFGYTRPQIVDPPEAEKIWRDLFSVVLESYVSEPERHAAVLAAFAKTNIGLDFVPLPKELFEASLTKRININVHGQGNDRFYMEGGRVPSRARAEEKRFEFNDLDEEAKGWRFCVRADWLRGFLLSVPSNQQYMHKFEAKLDELEALIERTTTMVTVEFAAFLLLATRK